MRAIDVTPTWFSLYPAMLEAFRNSSGDNRDALLIEFGRMASAADKWNAYAKAQREGGVRVETMNFSTTAKSRMRKANIHYLNQLLTYTEHNLTAALGASVAQGIIAVLALQGHKLFNAEQS